MYLEIPLQPPPMLDSLKNFYRRHRRKILAGGVVIGVYAASKYAINKYDEWQTAKVESAQHAARKRFHYESHQKTCTTTFISFLPNIRNMIMETMDTEQLLEILQMKPANKLEIWDQLKTLSLSRLISSVVANVLLLVVLKVKMNVIGAYLLPSCRRKAMPNHLITILLVLILNATATSPLLEILF